MRAPFGILAFSLLALPASAAEVNVRVTDGRVDLSATAAPIAEVLASLSKHTGMKVVYEGPAPRQLVTVSLHGRSPAEAVLGLLEGQGLNFILIGDASGDRVQTLMMAGSAPSTSSRPAASTPSGPQATYPPPASGPDADEPVEEAAEEETPEPAQAGQAPNGLPQLFPGGIPGGIPGAAPNPAVTPNAAPAPAQNTPPAVPIPGLPGFPTPASAPAPFAPQTPDAVKP